jgi:hypothetical protein
LLFRGRGSEGELNDKLDELDDDILEFDKGKSITGAEPGAVENDCVNDCVNRAAENDGTI